MSGTDGGKRGAGPRAPDAAGKGAGKTRAGRAAAKAAKAKKVEARQAKANRGYVKAGPLVGAALLAAGLAVFGIFFMNPLVERAAEAGLEAAFGARAEVRGLRFRPFRMSLSVASVSVADAASPMTDLFRTGRIDLRLSPSAALRGKVYIEEASAASIVLGAPRETSGALPDAEPEPKRGSVLPELPVLVDWENFDAKALLEREKSKLAAPAAYEAAGTAYEKASARWKTRRESSEAAVAKAQSSSKAALAVDPKAIRTAEQAARALALVKAAAQDVRTAGIEAKAVAEGIHSDSAALDRLVRDARAAAARDAAYLKSLATPGSGAARAALEPAVRALLTDKAETWLYYGGRFLAAAERLKGAKGAEKKVKPSPRGRDVVFPGAVFPAFRLGLLASSFQADGADWAVELREVSSEPDLVPTPSALRIEVRGPGGSRILADARADLRRTAGGAWDGSASAEGLPLDLKDALAGAGLAGFSGTLDGTAELQGSRDGGFGALLEASVRKPAVASPSGTLGKAAADALRNAGSVALHAEYRAVPGGRDGFTLRTDLDRILGEAVAAAGRQYAARASRELDEALREYTSEELEGKLAPKKGFDGIASGAEGDAASSASLENSLDKKQAEIEARAKALGADALKGITVPKIGP